MLRSLAALSIEQSIVPNLNFNDVINSFVVQKSRKKEILVKIKFLFQSNTYVF